MLPFYLFTDIVIENPAFGPSQIRELTEIFVDKAIEVSYTAVGSIQ